MEMNLVETQTSPTIRQRVFALAVAAGVIILDQLSKRFIEISLPLYRSWSPMPALAPQIRLSHVGNTGSAFGLFPSSSVLFAGAAVIVCLAILFYNYKLREGRMLLRLALGLQLGGALGNLTDRLRLGHVTDFFDLGSLPIFNLADMAIVLGALLLAWEMWRESRRYVSLPVEVTGMGSQVGQRGDGVG